jgi:hypothetical protein
MTAWGQRSIHEVVTEWHPAYDDKWKRWIRESYARYTSDDDALHLRGVKDFATILGDSGAPELCVLVALHGLRVAKTEQERNHVESHIRIVTVRLGMEQYKENIPPEYGVPPADYANREKWFLDRPAWERWKEHKLQDFAGDRKSASETSVRLACIHAGVLTGNLGLTFESLCDPLLWHLTAEESSH